MILRLAVKTYRRALVVILALFWTGILAGTSHVQAADGDPGRQAQLDISYTKSEWWLLRWSDNQLMCRIYTEDEGWPSGEKILAACGTAVYNQWKSTPACPALEEDRANAPSCDGLYLYFVSSQPAEKTITVELPPLQVWVTLSGCTPTSPENLCPELPGLLLTGEEPLPNEHITAIHALLNGTPYSCEAITCTLPLTVTPVDGLSAEFWADSSYGDSSEHFTAQIRVIDSGVSASPVGSGFYVDVLSTQWRGAPILSCAQTWEAFPPVGGPPTWLSTPEVPELLASDETYYFLAGRLIASGEVDASGCPEGGLLANGYATACGLDAALPLVQEWQNQFDARIIAVAQETNIPAQLMKNLFAQESQFWPGVFKDPKEFGLGQITENGAETVLLWNTTFYEQFCPLVLTEAACKKGYAHLDAESQATLRGALALQAKSDCPDCAAGIDLSNADFSITLFAETLRANCDQVGQIMYNGTNQIAGKVSNYEDLWRFTLANYHAGPGCVSYAIHTAWSNGAPMDWEHVKPYFTPPCQGVISYVEKIAR